MVGFKVWSLRIWTHPAGPAAEIPRGWHILPADCWVETLRQTPLVFAWARTWGLLRDWACWLELRTPALQMRSCFGLGGLQRSLSATGPLVAAVQIQRRWLSCRSCSSCAFGMLILVLIRFVSSPSALGWFLWRWGAWLQFDWLRKGANKNPISYNLSTPCPQQKSIF